MKIIHEGKKYIYLVSEDGIIYRGCGSGIKEVPKRLNQRGYLELKMDGKHYSYKREVAKALVPNLFDCDKVFSKDGNQFNTHPSNLRWVWTREKRNLTFEEWKKHVKDPKLIEYAKTGDKRHLIKAINKHFESIFTKLDPDLVADLYLKLTEYANRNLIFHLKNDSKQTYFGLKKQRHRKQIKTISYDALEKITF